MTEPSLALPKIAGSADLGYQLLKIYNDPNLNQVQKVNLEYLYNNALGMEPVWLVFHHMFGEGPGKIILPYNTNGGQFTSGELNAAFFQLFDRVGSPEYQRRLDLLANDLHDRGWTLNFGILGLADALDKVRTQRGAPAVQDPYFDIILPYLKSSLDEAFDLTLIDTTPVAGYVLEGLSIPVTRDNTVVQVSGDTKFEEQLSSPLIPVTPAEIEAAEALANVATYLGWLRSIAGVTSPEVAQTLDKIITTVSAASTLIYVLHGNPAYSNLQADDAALALFNVAASFSPELARIAPFITTGHQAVNFIQGLTSSNGFLNAGQTSLSGFNAVPGIAAGLGLANSIASIAGAPDEVQVGLQVASLIGQGVQIGTTTTTSATGATVALSSTALPWVGLAVGVTTLVAGLLTRNNEVWSKWQTALTNVSVEGGQNPETGEVLQNDTVLIKTSNKDRNRVQYIADASESELVKVEYAFVHEESDQTVSEEDLEDHGLVRLIIKAEYKYINPDVDNATVSNDVYLSGDKARSLFAKLGDVEGNISASDKLIANFDPYILNGTVRFTTEHTTADFYTYDDFDLNGVPDLLRSGVIEGVRVANDGKYEVVLYAEKDHLLHGRFS